jgi:hypothetical protein
VRGDRVSVGSDPQANGDRPPCARVRDVAWGGPVWQSLHISVRREDEDLTAEDVPRSNSMNCSGFAVSCCHSMTWRNLILTAPGSPTVLLIANGPRSRTQWSDASPRYGSGFRTGAPRCEHSGVERLVHVRLRGRDVVLEALRDRRPLAADDAERRITASHRIRQDAHRHQVVDVILGAVLEDDLAVDRPKMLRTALDLCHDSRGVERLFQGALHLEIYRFRSLAHGSQTRCAGVSAQGDARACACCAPDRRALLRMTARRRRGPRSKIVQRSRRPPEAPSAPRRRLGRLGDRSGRGF